MRSEFRSTGGLNDAAPPMLAFEDAQAAAIDACRPLAHERVALASAARRVLALDALACEDLVPFARSAMDGFAVRATDVFGMPAVLPVTGDAFAGSGPQTLPHGMAMAIATGAPLPAGADAVIPSEYVERSGDTIVVNRPVVRGASIFPPGDDARRGDVLPARGATLGAAAIGLLASAGIAEVAVVRRPTVAVVCGGDELTAIDRTPQYGQVRNSNGVMLAAAVTAAGGVALAPVCLRDTRAAVRAALIDALATADLVVTTGGASVGMRDFIKPVCDELGVEFFFRRVALRPAKPTAFGRRGGGLIAVLPGNPAAAFVAFAEFVGPAIRALSGCTDARLPRVSAVLAGTIRAKPERHFAAFAALAAGRDGLIATPLPNQCSSLTRTAADAAGLIIVPPGPHAYLDGDRVDVDVLDWTKLGVRHRSADGPTVSYALTGDSGSAYEPSR